MKRSLAAILIENSKTAKKVDGEIRSPAVDNIHTPDNHLSGKNAKTVDGKKGLGDRPKDKRAASATPPKSRERRSMTEGKVGDALMGMLMKFSGPKFGRQLYDQLKQDEPEMYHDLLAMFKELISKGAVTDRAQMTALMSDPRAQNLAMKLRSWAEDKLPPEFDQWAARKIDKLGGDYVMDPDGNDDDFEESAGLAGPAKLRNNKGNQRNRDEGIKKRSDKFHARNPVAPRMMETLGDSPDSKGKPTTTAAKNKDEGQKKPKVAKGDGVTRGARIGTIGGNKDNPANIGKTRKLPASYTGGVKVTVAKVKESLEDLANFLGVDLEVSTRIIESNYPDNFSQSAFDQHYGTDAAYDEAVDAMKGDVTAFLKYDAGAYIADYNKYKNSSQGRADPAWYLEHLSGMVETVYEVALAAMRNDGSDFDVDEDILKPMIVNFFNQSGVDPADIPAAFTDYMGEGALGEDSLTEPSPNTVDGIEDMLEPLGYSLMGGGFMGGEKSFKNHEGDIVSVAVHSFRPQEVIGWKAKVGGTTQQGKTADDLSMLLSSLNDRQPVAAPAAQQPAKRPSMGQRVRGGINRMMGRGGVGEMSSGGAVGSGAIASTAGGAKRPKGSLFAGEVEVDHIPQTVEEYVARLDPYMQKTYHMSWDDASGEEELIKRAIGHGYTPEEFADAWARSNGIDGNGGDDWVDMGESIKKYGMWSK